jgi:hypothetical protein
MEAVFSPLMTELLKLGLPGIVIIGLSIMLWLERQENKRLSEARVTDARVFWSALTENTVATKDHTSALVSLREAMLARK